MHGLNVICGDSTGNGRTIVSFTGGYDNTLIFLHHISIKSQCLRDWIMRKNIYNYLRVLSRSYHSSFVVFQTSTEPFK